MTKPTSERFEAWVRSLSPRRQLAVGFFVAWTVSTIAVFVVVSVVLTGYSMIAGGGIGIGWILLYSYVLGAIVAWKEKEGFVEAVHRQGT